MTHYETIGQITKTKKYEFKLPKFGKSTTDPTYYEPTATRIANMRKSAQSGKSLYDFEYEKGKKFTPEELLELHDKINITPGRKPGLTQEEIAQNLTDAKSKYEDLKADQKAEIENDAKEIKKMKNQLKALGSDENNSNKDEGQTSAASEN